MKRGTEKSRNSANRAIRRKIDRERKHWNIRNCSLFGQKSTLSGIQKNSMSFFHFQWVDGKGIFRGRPPPTPSRLVLKLSSCCCSFFQVSFNALIRFMSANVWATWLLSTINHEKRFDIVFNILVTVSSSVRESVVERGEDGIKLQPHITSWLDC